MRVAEKEREVRFDALFTAYLADITAYCRWRAPSAADAQDAVSDVFLAAWRRLDEIPAGEEARLWLYGTARRILANQARSTRRKERLQARLSTTSNPEPALEAASDDLASPEAGAVRVALRRMAAADQEVLLLAEWEGLSPAEIGTVLGCPAVTARGKLFRARRRFRAAFEAVAQAEPEPTAGFAAADSLSMTTSRGVVR
jgi:RNA polymerase sigma factor (sigma-70 family)